MGFKVRDALGGDADATWHGRKDRGFHSPNHLQFIYGTGDWFEWSPHVDMVDLGPYGKPVATVMPSVAPSADDIGREFERLAGEWSAGTAIAADPREIVLHPAYQQIIGLGPLVVPHILNALRQRRDHWFWALAAITRRDEAAGTENFDEAADAWLEWGVRTGLLP